MNEHTAYLISAALLGVLCGSSITVAVLLLLLNGITRFAGVPKKKEKE